MTPTTARFLRSKADAPGAYMVSVAAGDLRDLLDAWDALRLVRALAAEAQKERGA